MHAPARSSQRRFLGVSFVAALLLGALWYALGPGSASDRAATVRASDAPPELRASAPLEVPLQAPAETAPSAERTRQSALVAEGPGPAVATVELAELRGRVVLPDGAPAANAFWNLRGYKTDRVSAYGSPSDWTDLEGRTDADGEFSIRFDPPGALEFLLDVSQTDFVKVSWHWSSLRPSETIDVGEVRLAPAGRVRGRIIDGSGKPQGAGWSVHATAEDGAEALGRQATRCSAKVDPTTGEFLIEGLPGGRAQLTANSRMAGWIEGPHVDVQVGAETTADIVYLGPDNARRITLTTFHRTLYLFSDPAPGTIVLSGPGGERVATRVRGASQKWNFTDLEPGAYEVEIRDPRFRPWKRSGVATGTSMDVELEGSSAVQLSVEDSQGNNIEDYELRLRFLTNTFSPNEFVLRAAGTPRPADGIYRGLMPIATAPSADTMPDLSQLEGEELVAALENRMGIDVPAFELLVHAPGFGTTSGEVLALAPGETKEVTLVVQTAAMVRGTVAGVGPEVLDYLSVVLAADSVPTETALEYWERPGWNDGMSGVRTNSAGEFAFTDVPAGSYRVFVRFHHDFHAEYGPFHVASGENAEIEVRAPPHGAIEGRILAHPENLRDAWVEVRAEGRYNHWEIEWAEFDGEHPPRVRVDPEGRFWVYPVGLGTHSVALHKSPTSLQSDPKEWRSNLYKGGTLGTVTLTVPEVVSVEFELGTNGLGTIDCEATVDGLPAVGLHVKARFSSTDQPQGPKSPHEFLEGVGEDGTARLGWMTPGTWNVGLMPEDGLWCVWASEPVELEAGDAAHVRIDVELHTGRLQVLDAETGEPRANDRVLWSHGDQMSFVRTDAEGVLELRLPIGTYTLRRGRNTATLQWTTDGPDMSAVEL